MCSIFQITKNPFNCLRVQYKFHNKYVLKCAQYQISRSLFAHNLILLTNLIFELQLSLTVADVLIAKVCHNVKTSKQRFGCNKHFNT